MSKIIYHISSDGSAKPCRASVKQCPLAAVGAEHNAFETLEEAQQWAESVLAFNNGGSFGQLAKRLAEKEIDNDAVKVEDDDKRQLDELRETVRNNYSQLFTKEKLSDLYHGSALKRRSIKKQFDSAYFLLVGNGEPNTKQAFVNFLDTADYNVMIESERKKVRELLGTARFVKLNDQSSGNTAIDQRVERYHKQLDSIPNESKPELIPDTDSIPDFDISQISDKELAKELSITEEREEYLSQWRPESKTRVLLYGESSERSIKRFDKLFGEKYTDIVNDGQWNGFTQQEAIFYQNQLPELWQDYHAQLEAEAIKRLD